ncbi:hypothetical protein ACFV5N_11595 [Streptomyces sp. NPDC059853]|uniref:hypothetical protein n=1 Tax=Streptomyces sp. NPDC059853 TaxID=3346973 RepID=UPI00366918F0
MRPSVPVALVPLIALTLTGCLSVDPDTEAPGAGPTEAGNASPLVEEAAGEAREEAVPDGDGPPGSGGGGGEKPAGAGEGKAAEDGKGGKDGKGERDRPAASGPARASRAWR